MSPRIINVSSSTLSTAGSRISAEWFPILLRQLHTVSLSGTTWILQHPRVAAFNITCSVMPNEVQPGRLMVWWVDQRGARHQPVVYTVQRAQGMPCGTEDLYYSGKCHGLHHQLSYFHAPQ